MVVLLVTLATIWHDRKDAEARSSRPSSAAKHKITMDDAVGFLDGLWAVKKPQGPPRPE